MSKKIKQHFVTLEGRWGPRQVHYRRAGSGPLLLMLHQSPRSSRELVPLMQQWGEHFTIVAPDSPGYGLSDLLDADTVELDDFASATMEFMDAIGAGRFGIYGFHTGGMIGIAIAQGYPGRVASFACNGVAVPTDDELGDILANYFPRFEPRWDGSHLSWLWAKNREQTIFFPWYRHTLAGRLDFPLASPGQLQSGVLEFLRAADHYHVAYRAAFVSHTERVVPGLKVPGLITAAGTDPLQPHLARLEDVPGCVQVMASDTQDQNRENCLEQVRAHTGDELPAAPATLPMPGRLWKQLIEVDEGTVMVNRGGEGLDQPVVVLHGAGGSSATIAFITAGLAENRSVLSIDLPGHGETDLTPGHGGATIETCAKLVLAVIRQLNLQSVDLVGVEGGACVAVEIALRHPDSIARLALVHPTELNVEQADEWNESGLPSLEPDWAGGHLQRCWHMVRDSRMYFPWFRRDRTGIRWQEPELDDRRIQLEVTEYLKAEGAWQEMLRDQLDYPLLAKLATCRNKVILCASPRSPWYVVTGNMATRTNLNFSDLDDDPGKWGLSLAMVLSQ